MSRDPTPLADLSDAPSPEAEFMGGLIRAQRSVRPPEEKIEELVARLGPLIENLRTSPLHTWAWLATSVAVFAAIGLAAIKLGSTYSAQVVSGASAPPPALAPALSGEAIATAPDPAPESRTSAVAIEALPTVNVPKTRAPDARRCDEVALVDAVDTELRSGNPERALAAVRAHEQRCAEGALVQERERMAIEALVKLGRLEQARARARAFEERFPTSPYLRRVRQVAP